MDAPTRNAQYARKVVNDAVPRIVASLTGKMPRVAPQQEVILMATVEPEFSSKCENTWGDIIS